MLPSLGATLNPLIPSFREHMSARHDKKINTMIYASKRYFVFAAVLCLGLVGALHAEDATSTASSDTPTNSDSLEEVVVRGVSLEDQVSPLQRRVSSVLGLEMSVLDTPRSVTEINLAQIRDESIVDVTDFVKIVSSAYTNDQFGGPNVPFLRGQSAEVFQNGMLRTPRSDGQPLSFNSVEGFDIVKGPADVVYGPTGNVGGYVNLVTKRPYFDGEHTTATVTWGDYGNRKAQLDVSGPVTDKLAYRLSYEGDFSSSYYRFGYDHSDDIYLALRYLPNSQLTIDFNTEFYLAHYTENTGINRPTQQLIDSGLYYQGTGVSPFPVGSDPRGFDSVINVTGVVPINRSWQLVAPNDHDEGTNYQAQLDVTDLITDNLTIANKAYFEDYSQLQLEYAQRYYNNIAESYNFEDRFELRGKWSNNQFITGVAYRFMHVLAYGDYWNEYLNATDITTNPASFPITQLFGVLPVPGSPNQFATPGASYNSTSYPDSIVNTQDQTSNQIGLFFQDIYNVTSKLSVLGGLRVDGIHEKLTDPLPPPGFVAARASTNQAEEAVDTSVTYKAAPWNTFYVTVDFNESPVTSNGGGFDGFTGDRLLSSDFHIKNWLYETGSKMAFYDNTLYVTSAAYFQKRGQTDQFDHTVQVETLGAELEANYQPNKNFSATAAYSYLDAWYPSSSTPGLSAFTENVYDAFAAPYGTGFGSPNFSPLPPGRYHVPSVPGELFSGFAKYRTDFGVGASVGLVVTGPMTTSYLGNVKIPTQYTLDSGLFYEATRWAVHANLYNITNRKNWIPEGGPEGNDLITAAMPFHFQISATYRF